MWRAPSFRRLGVVLCALSVVVLGGVVPAAAQTATAAEVSVGSPSGRTPQNHQNEPAVAMDAHAPNVLVSGWNDFVDWSPCPQQTATEEGTCARPEDSGVGLSAVGFSFDSGRSWVQPTYTGWSARDGTPSVGPIGTLPWYFEADIVSDTPEAAYLEGIYVHPQERRKGYGLRCMSQLSHNLLARTEAVCLVVNQKHKDAQSFYRKASYTHICDYDTIYLQELH